MEMERATGIEPAFSAWEADVLPLNYARSGGDRCYSAGGVRAARWRADTSAHIVIAARAGLSVGGPGDEPLWITLCAELSGRRVYRVRRARITRGRWGSVGLYAHMSPSPSQGARLPLRAAQHHQDIASC